MTSPDDVTTLAATGFTGKTVEGKRFWVAFNAGSRTWKGGHTAPSTGVLPVTHGAYIVKPEGVILYGSGNEIIGRADGFHGSTPIGATGRGLIGATAFEWKAS